MVICNDLWKVTIPHSSTHSFNYSGNSVVNTVPQPIPYSDRLYAAIQGSDNTTTNPGLATTGQCVEKVTVEVGDMCMHICVFGRIIVCKYVC